MGVGVTFKQASDFIAKWKQVLAPEWTITVHEGHNPTSAPDDVLASIRPQDDYLRATLFTGDTVGDKMEHEEAEQVLLHELLHLTTHDFYRAAVNSLDSLGPDAASIASRAIDSQSERLVDRLAEAFIDARKVYKGERR